MKLPGLVLTLIVLSLLGCENGTTPKPIDVQRELVGQWWHQEPIDTTWAWYSYFSADGTTFTTASYIIDFHGWQCTWSSALWQTTDKPEEVIFAGEKTHVKMERVGGSSRIRLSLYRASDGFLRNTYLSGDVPTTRARQCCPRCPE
jgi:hypothetical protein